MRIHALVALFALLSATAAGAVVDFSVGALGGMDIPVANDVAKSGPLFGIQGKVPAFVCFFSIYRRRFPPERG